MDLDRQFAFRGERNYLQSASLFDDLIALRGEAVRDIDFKFHKRTGRQVRYVDSIGDGQVAVAEWADSNGSLHVVEREEEIAGSTPYDEPVLVAKFEQRERSTGIPADVAPFSRIEAYVAAFKHLLQALFPDIPRKYVFVRIRLRYLPNGPSEVEYARKIGDFFQGNILVEGNRIGEIYFGEWR